MTHCTKHYDMIGHQDKGHTTHDCMAHKALEPRSVEVLNKLGYLILSPELRSDYSTVLTIISERGLDSNTYVFSYTLQPKRGIINHSLLLASEYRECFLC